MERNEQQPETTIDRLALTATIGMAILILGLWAALASPAHAATLAHCVAPAIANAHVNEAGHALARADAAACLKTLHGARS